MEFGQELELDVRQERQVERQTIYGPAWKSVIMIKELES